MTKCKISLLSLALLMLLCGVAQAQTTCFGAQGSATVPGLFTIYGSSTYHAASHIFLSNVSNTTVTCKVTLFSNEGVDITSSYSEVLNQGTTVTTGANDFEIPAGGTRMLRFKTSNTNDQRYAFALVEWKSSDPKLRKALIGMHYRQQTVGSSYQVSDTNINGGQPF